MSCQTAFQLSRFARENPFNARYSKGTVDWIICPTASLAMWLRSGLCDFELGEITLRNGVPWWGRFDIYF